jgi:predicted DNA-binding transcriptional regulator AlpA
MSESLPQYLTAKQLGELIGINEITLGQWRHRNKGPTWIRLPGVRTIRYARADVEAWLAAGTVRA